MLEERFVLKDSMGLHARPAAQLMMALKDIQSAVTISGNGEQVDGKDVIQILSLGCVQGGSDHLYGGGAGRREGHGSDPSGYEGTGLLTVRN